jgi:translation initiation factor 2 beta subunit (eIF-2beta)/eIF-5
MASASNIPSVQAVLEGLQFRSAQIEVGNTTDLGKWVTALKNAHVDTSKEIAFLFRMNSTPVRIGVGVLFNGGTEAQVFASDGVHFFQGHSDVNETIVWDTFEHEDLTGRDAEDSHPEKAVTGLVSDLADRILKASIQASAEGRREVVTALDISKVGKESVEISQHKSDVDTGLSHVYKFDLWVADEDRAGLFGVSQFKSLLKVIADNAQLRDDFTKAVAKLEDEISDEEAARKAAIEVLSNALIEEARLARAAEHQLQDHIDEEKAERIRIDALKIDKDSIKVSGNNRRQVVTALNYRIGAEEAVVEMYSSEVETKVHEKEEAIIPAATVDHAGLESKFDKVKIEGAVQKETIANGTVVTDVKAVIGESSADVTIKKSNVYTAQSQDVSVVVPGASTSAAGLMTKADKIEQARVAAEVVANKKAIDDEIEEIGLEIADLHLEDGILHQDVTDLEAKSDRKDSDLDSKISTEIDRAFDVEEGLRSDLTALDAASFKKASVRVSEGTGQRKLVTGFVVKVATDKKTVGVTEYASDVEGGKSETTFTLIGEDGIDFDQTTPFAASIKGTELKNDISSALTEAKAYTDGEVSTERSDRIISEAAALKAENEKVAAIDATIAALDAATFKKASIPASGNGRNQLLTAIDLVEDDSGPVSKWTVYQHSVDKEGVAKAESYPLPEATPLRTGLFTNVMYNKLYSDVTTINDGSDDGHYPTAKAVREFVINKVSGVGQYSGTYDYIGLKAEISALTPDTSKLTGPITAIALDPTDDLRLGKYENGSWTWVNRSFNVGDYVVGRTATGQALGQGGRAIWNADGNFDYDADDAGNPDGDNITLDSNGAYTLTLRTLANGDRVLNSILATNIEYANGQSIADKIIKEAQRLTDYAGAANLAYQQLDTKHENLLTRFAEHTEDYLTNKGIVNDRLDEIASDLTAGDVASVKTAKDYTDALRTDVVANFPKKNGPETITGNWQFSQNPVYTDGRALGEQTVTSMIVSAVDTAVATAKAEVEAKYIELTGKIEGNTTRIDGLERRIGAAEVTIGEQGKAIEKEILDARAAENRLTAAVGLLETNVTKVLNTYVTGVKLSNGEVGSFEGGVITLPPTVYLTGDQSVSGVKDFVNGLTHNKVPVLSALNPQDFEGTGVWTLKLKRDNTGINVSWVKDA